MNMNTRILLVSLSVVILMGAVNAACTNPSETAVKVLSAQWGNSTHPISVGPGSVDVPLTITMESSGSVCSLSNIAGTFNFYGDISNFNGSDIATDYLQSAAASSIFDMVFHLNIANSTTAGPNVIASYPFYISWNYTGNESIRYTQVVNVSMPISGSPLLSFSIPNPDLLAGQNNNITIHVSNSGTGNAYKVSMSPTSSPIINILSNPMAINVLKPGASENVTLAAYIPPTLSGQQVTLNLNPYYISPLGYNTSASSTIGLYVLQNQGGIKISTSNQTVFSGKTNNVSLTISNNGAAPIYNISVSLSPGSSLSIINSDESAFVPVLAPYAKATIPLDLYPSSGTVASLGVSLSYSGGSISRTLSFLTPGYVNISTVTTTVIPAAPTSGEIFSLTSNLDNLGSESAYAVTVTPYPPKGIRIEGENTTFIGDIPAYTPTAFTLSFISSPSMKSGTYDIPVTLSYVNNINQKLNQTFIYTVEIGSASGFNGTAVSVKGGHNSSGSPGNGTFYYYRRSAGLPIVPIAAVVVVIVIVAVAYTLHKRGKNKK